MNREFRSEHPHQGNRSAFRRSVAPGDFHLKGTSGFTRSLSLLYAGRDQYKTAFELGFLFLVFNNLYTCSPLSGVIVHES